jgi:hypothetical protein
MTENCVPQEAGRTTENKLEEVNEKIAFARKLIAIGAITSTEDIPEEAFARMSELAALPYFHNSESVQVLAAIEFLFDRLSGTSELHEAANDIKENLAEIVQELFSDEFADVDDDTLAVVVNLTIAKVAAGERFMDALLAAVADRKEVLRATPELTGYVDSQDSVVNLENPRQ